MAPKNYEQLLIAPMVSTLKDHGTNEALADYCLRSSNVLRDAGAIAKMVNAGVLQDSNQQFQSGSPFVATLQVVQQDLIGYRKEIGQNPAALKMLYAHPDGKQLAVSASFPAAKVTLDGILSRASGETIGLRHAPRIPKMDEDYLQKTAFPSWSPQQLALFAFETTKAALGERGPALQDSKSPAAGLYRDPQDPVYVLITKVAEMANQACLKTPRAADYLHLLYGPPPDGKAAAVADSRELLEAFCQVGGWTKAKEGDDPKRVAELGEDFARAGWSSTFQSGRYTDNHAYLYYTVLLAGSGNREDESMNVAQGKEYVIVPDQARIAEPLRHPSKKKGSCYRRIEEAGSYKGLW